MSALAGCAVAGAEGVLGGAAECFEQTLDPGQAVLRIPLQTIFDCGGQVASPRTPKIVAVPARLWALFLALTISRSRSKRTSLWPPCNGLAISH